MASRSRSRRPKQRGGVFALARKISGEGKPLWIKGIRWITFLGVSGIVTGALAFFALYRMIEIPDENADFLTQTTKVYFSDGEHEIGTFATQDRESISIDDIPASMQSAVIAAEDRSFYSNNGIDFRGIARALRDNTTSGEITGGGSTITQQYVKILYLTQERTYTRKVKEAILSIKIHNQRSKDEILEGYLNTVYYGNGAYGVQVAAKTYFNKLAKDLTVQESAALATIINIPSYYDPYTEGGTERMLNRYNYVIDGMAKAGAITAEEAAEFTGNLPEFAEKKVNNRFAGTNGFLLDMVQTEMRKLEFTDSQIYGGGLRIVTSFDYEKQKDAVEAIKQVRPDGLPELHSAIVAVEPGDGGVRALYGGPDFLESQLNWATLGTQPGSTFKIFGVIAGLEDGYGLKTELNGSSPLRFPNDNVIENQGDSGGASFGKVDMTKATAKSINTAFVDLVNQMSDGADISKGSQKVLEAALDAGIPQSTVDKIEAVYATVLGYAPVAPIDMANAYATVAAGGLKADWYVIDQVLSADGTELHKHEVKTKRTISEDVAGDTIAALRAVTASGGTGTNGRSVCPVAGKTGTATAGVAPNVRVSSSWFVGTTPKLATAVMYNRGKGNEQLRGYLNPFFGGTYPARTFAAFMNQALDRNDCGSFPKPGNIKASKGTEYKPPPPKCAADEMLNEDKTKCIPTPVQEECGPGEVPDGNLGCMPDPTPTPTPTPDPGFPTTPPPFGTPEAACIANPNWEWDPGAPLGQRCKLK